VARATTAPITGAVWMASKISSWAKFASNSRQINSLPAFAGAVTGQQ
jgi:hypothetical protein